MAKVRVTAHSGRVGSARHNDRDFDTALAPHIDPTRTADNLTYCIYDGMTFAEAELRFYRETFGQELAERNARYKADGHPERARTMEQVIATKNKAPDETILQIGNKDDDIDFDTFRLAIEDFRRWKVAKYGKNVVTLDGALHADETSYHYHDRDVFVWVDADGQKHLGQEKALEQAGLSLPDPSKPRSRYNNRKMTYTKECREKWIEICESYGYDVEKVPIPGAKHKSKDDFIKDKEREKGLEQREAALKVREQEVARKSLQVKMASKQLTEALQQAQELLDDIQDQKAKEALQGRLEAVQRPLPSNAPTTPTAAPPRDFSL